MNKYSSFSELRSIRDAMLVEQAERYAKQKAEHKSTSTVPEDNCPECHGAGVLSNQGADVCCPLCQGCGYIL